MVVLHELAHIKRLMTQLACAVHWFNPLVWMAARRIKVQRERACDDVVLGAGFRPSEYAEHVLYVGSRLSSDRLAGCATIAMARHSEMEGRLLAILDQSQSRKSLTRATIAAGIALVCLISILLGMSRVAVGTDGEGQTSTAIGESAKANSKQGGKQTEADKSRRSRNQIQFPKA